MRQVALATWLLAGHAAVNARLLRDPPPVEAGRRSTPLVSVLIPARNEAGRIGPCVAAVMQSRGVDLEVIILDDGSSDGTARIAAAAAADDPRVRIVTGAPLPPGWLGKPHACAQLARQAQGQLLAFLDADVVVTPDGLARSVALLDSGPLDMVCPYPRQIVDGAATRIVQPLLQWSWLTFLPLRLAERSPRPSLVAANGQLLLCRRGSYDTAGGHAAVKDAVLEDMELARAFKRAGMRAGVVAGHEIATCAMYRNWDELRAGYTKSLWAAFGTRPGAVAVVTLLVALYVAPPLATVIALARGNRMQAGWPMAATAGGVLGRVVSARRTGGVATDAVWHPVSIAALAGLTRSSFRACARGGLSWRGRALPGRSQT